MTYFDKYISALEFLVEFHPEIAREAGGIGKARDYLLSCQSEDQAPAYSKLVERLITPLAKFHVEKTREINGEMARSCHAVSDGFLRTYTQSPKLSEISRHFPMAITIGDVSYKGRNIYHVTRNSVRAIMNRGRNLNEDLHVHVWLTLVNMTVVDLTIASYLRGKGE